MWNSTLKRTIQNETCANFKLKDKSYMQVPRK